MNRLIVLLLLTILVSSCENENRNLLRTLKGRWQVKSVLFSNAPGKLDSAVTPKSIYWELEACNDERNGNVAENCELAYFEDNNKKLSFSYYVDASGGRISKLNIRAKKLPNPDPDFERVSQYLMNGYVIDQQSDRSIKLSCNERIRDLDGQIPEYRAIEWRLER